MWEAGSSPTSTVARPRSPRSATSRATSSRILAASALPSSSVAMRCDVNLRRDALARLQLRRARSGGVRAGLWARGRVGGVLPPRRGLRRHRAAAGPRDSGPLRRRGPVGVAGGVPGLRRREPRGVHAPRRRDRVPLRAGAAARYVRERLVKPPRVRPGDTVAIVSPSAPAFGRFPHRGERGTAYLESLGLRVRPMRHAAGVDGWVSAPPEARAADLHEAFADPEVAVVLCAIGGNHSNQVLPHLDFDLIRANPKIFQGYSDMTILHWAIGQETGLSTFYGPALVPELGEFPEVLPLTDRFLRDAWFGAEPLRYEPASEWT